MSMFTLEEVNQAINMAVDETSRKAVEVLSSVLDNWVHGGESHPAWVCGLKPVTLSYVNSVSLRSCSTSSLFSEVTTILFSLI